jgi:predicted acetyltransferase
MELFMPESLTAELVQPSIRYQTSFLQAVREFQAEGEWLHYHHNQLDRDFAGFVESILNRVESVNLLPNRVPESFFWLVEGDEFIGRISIRHRLNASLRQVGGHIGYEIRPSRRRQGYGTLMLKLALPEVKKIGLDRAMITCDADNIGSKKIIEANGGQFEKSITLDYDRTAKLHYWVELSK